jgi:DNA-binding GntR family transcriptional regulator
MAKQPFITLRPEAKGQLSFDHPTANQLFGFVRDAIISMEFLPGQMISESSLASQFGVSRTPVREAIIQLANIGFVEVLPQRGTYVTKFSMKKILAARFIREAIEVSVVSYLAENVTNDIIIEGEKIIREQKIAADDRDTLAFHKLDDKFHQTLANCTQFLRVADVVEAEKAHMDRVRCLSLQEYDQFQRILEQHTAIIKAIKSGVPEQAAKAMSVHLKDVYNLLKVIPLEHPEYFE